MRKRSTEILQSFLNNNKKILTIKELAAKYDVSQKTLQNDMKEINQLLKTIPMAGIEINTKGELVKPKDFNSSVVKEFLYNMDIYTYKLSTEERQIYIMMLLAVSKTYVTMKQFADELGVSRITIVNDMEIIKERFSSYGADILLDPGKGMHFRGEDKIKVNILADLYRQIAINNINDGFFQRMILKRMDIHYSFSEIFSYIQEYMQANQMVFTDDSFYDIVLYLFVVFNFCNKEGRTIDHNEKLSNIDHLISYAGVMLNVNVTQNMLYHFREYIEEHNLHAFVKTVDEIELYKVIMRFIGTIDEELKLNLSSDNKLMDSLLMHIRNMKDWGNYEVELPSEYDSVINYDLLQELVEENAHILEDFLAYQLSDNMKKSIVIHICVAVIRNRRYMNRFSVAIVCPGSMATGKYLEAQIKNYFDFDIVGIWAAGEVIRKLDECQTKIDYIISTVPLKTEKYTVIQVHPFLQMEDMNRIQKLVFQKQKLPISPLSPLNQRISIVKNMIHDVMDDKKLAELLCEKMEEVIKEYQQTYLHKTRNPIGKLLKASGVQLEEDSLAWRDAIRKAAKPLVTEGFIEKLYVEKSIESVEEYGAYIILSDGVALAHAKKEYGVNQNCLSLLVSKPGIVFDETERKVHLLFMFASTGQEEHLEILKAIIQIGRADNKVSRICQLTSVGDVYDEIVYG